MQPHIGAASFFVILKRLFLFSDHDHCHYCCDTDHQNDHDRHYIYTVTSLDSIGILCRCRLSVLPSADTSCVIAALSDATDAFTSS